MVALVGCVFMGCRKEPNIDTNYSRFSGKWEYEQFIGYPSNNFLPPGNGQTMILGKDGSFERKQDDSLIFKGEYFLKGQGSCTETENILYFSSTENAYSERAITIEGDRLLLTTPPCYADGGVIFYRKVAER